MQQVWVGAILLLVGLVFCFFGHRIARFALTLGGAALGYLCGMVVYVGIAALPVAPDMWRAIPEWLVGLVFGVLFALASYAFYAGGVLLLLGTVGWTIAQVVFGFVHVPQNWQLGVSIACALVLAGIGVAADIPRNLMIVGTAALGAALCMASVQLLTSQVIQWLNPLTWGFELAPHLIWMAGFAVLTVVGIIAQRRQPGAASLRAAYPG